jgi:hypothetical protein
MARRQPVPNPKNELWKGGRSPARDAKGLRQKRTALRIRLEQFRSPLRMISKKQ